MAATLDTSAGDASGPAPAPAPAVARLRGLDALRALAVLLVLGRHLDVATGQGAGDGPLFAAVRRGGWVGVDLFFVLSGFLVSGLVFREHSRTGRFAPWAFLARRGLKIYPAFYVFLLVTVALAVVMRRPPPVERVVAEALFLSNYFKAVNVHTWSLSVEEHFYLLLTALLAGAAWRSRLRPAPLAEPFAIVVPLSAILLVVCLALRLLVADVPYEAHVHLFPTHLRIDALLFGVALSYLHHHAPDGRLQRLAGAWPRALLALGALLLAPAFVLDVATSASLRTVGLTVITLGGGALLLGTLHAPRPTSRAGEALVRAAAWMGGFSYSIYLWHLLVATITDRAFVRLGWPDRPIAVSVVTYGVAAVLGGVIAARLIELPVLRLRDRWFPSRSGALAPPAL